MYIVVLTHFDANNLIISKKKKKNYPRYENLEAATKAFSIIYNYKMIFSKELIEFQ